MNIAANGKELRIREYEVRDKSDVLHLLALNTPQYFSPEEEQDLIVYLEQYIEQYFVAELDQVIVGCGGINFAEDNTAGRISWDIMHPDYQGKGYGSLLLSHRMNLLKADKNISAIAVRTSQLVYQFYEKSGFELREVVKDYWAPGYDLYRMEYPLGE